MFFFALRFLNNENVSKYISFQKKKIIQVLFTFGPQAHVKFKFWPGIHKLWISKASVPTLKIFLLYFSFIVIGKNRVFSIFPHCNQNHPQHDFSPLSWPITSPKNISNSPQLPCSVSVSQSVTVCSIPWPGLFWPVKTPEKPAKTLINQFSAC